MTRGAARARRSANPPCGDVVLESGATFHNPMRVLPNGDGSEVVFTLFRLPGMSDAQFAADAGAVERDLRELEALLERE